MFVFSNLATSLDGKIATSSREYFPLGTPEDRKHMQRLRAKSDVVLFGASSLRTFRAPCIVRGPEAKKIRVQPANAILSSKLEGLSPSWPFFKAQGFHRILFTGPQASSSKIALFEKSCEVIVLKKVTSRQSAAKQMLEALKLRGYKNVLVEGGGAVMWDFCRDNLIDEIHLTLTPRVLGGTEAPTLVDGKGLDPKDVLNFRLKSCRRVKDELYLIYRKKLARG